MSFLKHHYPVAIIILIALIVAGCGGTNGATAPPTPTATPTSIPTPTPSRTPQPTATPAPVDLDHLARYTGGDRAIDRDVLQLFVQQSSAMLAQLPEIE